MSECSGGACFLSPPGFPAGLWEEMIGDFKCESDMCGWKFKRPNVVVWKSVGMIVLLVMISVAVEAQNGQAGIDEANKQVRSYFKSGTNLMYAVGAILGLIGAVKVYSKWNSGDPDTSKVAASWFGSCIFLVVVTTIIKAFFNV